MTEELPATEAEWKRRLGPVRFQILRRKGTEPPFSGALLGNKEPGLYVCGGCGAELFSSETKFESGTGWPSFWAPLSEACVATEDDRSLGMRRVEVLCRRCGGHLGHVFDDGPPPTGKRYCINSLALDFRRREKA